jgi:hypothetical protein
VLIHQVNERVPVNELRQVATQDGSAVLETRLQFGDNPPARRFNLYPTVTINEDGSATIDDCTMVSPPIEAPSTGYYYRARVEQVDGSWIVTNTELVSTEGCAPAALAAEIIADYEAYWDALYEAWGPADPTNPALFATTTGEQLEFLIGLLSDFEGTELRGQPQINAEISGYSEVDQVEITDCQFPDPDVGLFDAATGDRLGTIDVPREGQRDGRVVLLVRSDDGDWQVSFQQGDIDADCQTPPTDRGLPDR